MADTHLLLAFLIQHQALMKLSLCSKSGKDYLLFEDPTYVKNTSSFSVEVKAIIIQLQSFQKPE